MYLLDAEYTVLLILLCSLDFMIRRLKKKIIIIKNKEKKIAPRYEREAVMDSWTITLLGLPIGLRAASHPPPPSYPQGAPPSSLLYPSHPFPSSTKGDCLSNTFWLGEGSVCCLTEYFFIVLVNIVLLSGLLTMTRTEYDLSCLPCPDSRTMHFTVRQNKDGSSEDELSDRIQQRKKRFMYAESSNRE